MLSSKIKLLIKILLIKYRILKLIWIAKPIELNEYSRELLNTVEWEYLGSLTWKNESIKYKKIPDATGDYRFYVPILGDNLAWRIDLDYSPVGHNKVPSILGLIAVKNGLRNDKLD